MKKSLYSFFILTCLCSTVSATTFNIDINGFTYSPDNLIVNVGDVVIIEAQSFHPLQQVNQANWDNNDNTPLAGGFSSTSPLTLTITAGMAGSTIYFVCAAHVGLGMKGKISVNVTSSVSDNRLLDYNFTVFPNPVTSNSWLNISTKKSSKVSITLYDITGKAVHNLADMNMQAGELTIPLKASLLQKGIYLIKMQTNMGSLQKQIVVY